MKKLFLGTLIALGFTSTSAHALTYNDAISQVKSIETTYTKCMMGNGQDLIDQAQCYVNASDKYDKLIQKIRREHSKNANATVWKAINLGHVDRANACTEDYDYLISRVYYVTPHTICKHQVSKSLALAAIKLHLK